MLFFVIGNNSLFYLCFLCEDLCFFERSMILLVFFRFLSFLKCRCFLYFLVVVFVVWGCVKLYLGFLGCLEHILSNLKPAKYKKINTIYETCVWKRLDCRVTSNLQNTKKQHNIRDMRVKKVGLPSCVFYVVSKPIVKLWAEHKQKCWQIHVYFLSDYSSM